MVGVTEEETTMQHEHYPPAILRQAIGIYETLISKERVCPSPRAAFLAVCEHEIARLRALLEANGALEQVSQGRR